MSIILIGPVLWVIQNMSYFYKTTDDHGGGLLRLQHCVWYVYGALLQQGIFLTDFNKYIINGMNLEPRL